jgi:hypothetical protein
MKRDSIEQFIQDHRQEFDDAVPSLKVWAEIDRQLQDEAPSRTKVVRLRWVRLASIAASVVILIAFGMGVGFYLSDSTSSEPVTLASVSPEYAEMEQYFTRSINDRMARLAHYEQGESVINDLEQIDEVMKELQEELRNCPIGGEERIVENLIRTYQVKIAILERVLERMETNQPTEIAQEDEISI